jgi:hypothetical protein
MHKQAVDEKVAAQKVCRLELKVSAGFTTAGRQDLLTPCKRNKCDSGTKHAYLILIEKFERVHMNKFLATIAAVAAFASVPAAAVINGGNAVISRPGVDSFTNFSILDGNNPISGNGTLKTWSIFAPANASAVRLLIYRTNGLGFNLVGSSDLETPGAAGGVQNFSLGGGLVVQGGDLVGLYFQGKGSALFSFSGGPMRYTKNNSGFANSTDFVGAGLSRTYSVSVESAVPEPATWGLLLVGFGMVGVAARRRSAAVTA